MNLKASVLLSTVAFCGAAFAQTTAPEPDYTLSFNVGAVTEYRYRGIAQTRFDPALQGGIDFAHKSGFYTGTWASTIKWIDDAGGNADVEVDFYAGYKGFSAGPVAWSRRAVATSTPSHDLAGQPQHTRSTRGPVGPATVKYSHSVTNLFGFSDSKNSYYVDLSATFDTGVWGLSLTPHIGYQKVKNNGDFSYTDYAITLGKDFGNGLSASAAVVGTDSDKNLYVTPSGKHSGKTGLVVGVKYAF